MYAASRQDMLPVVRHRRAKIMRTCANVSSHLGLRARLLPDYLFYQQLTGTGHNILQVEWYGQGWMYSMHSRFAWPHLTHPTTKFTHSPWRKHILHISSQHFHGIPPSFSGGLYQGIRRSCLHIQCRRLGLKTNYVHRIPSANLPPKVMLVLPPCETHFKTLQSQLHFFLHMQLCQEIAPDTRRCRKLSQQL